MQVGDILITLMPFLVIILIFYFFLFRPEAKKEKQRRQFLENLKKGDKVITIGGIEGKIVGISDNHIVIESEGNRLKILKKAISMEYTQALFSQKLQDNKDKQQAKQ